MLFRQYQVAKSKRILRSTAHRVIALPPVAHTLAILLLLTFNVNAVEVDDFKTDCLQLTQAPHRLTGTDEYRRAAEYVAQRLRDIGLDEVIEQDFVAAQTQILRCEMELGDESGLPHRTLPLLPMRPNGIIPPITGPDGISGPIYHARLGTPKVFGERSPHGCIVVMEYRAGREWMRAFRLGAVAVIFTPGDELRSEQTHHANANANLPRFYYEGAPADLEAGKRATIHSQIVWRQAVGRNVLGFIPGTNPVYRFAEKEELILLAASLDSFGEIPNRTPGARGAATCAALLQVAEELVRNTPANKRRHILVAFLDSRARGNAGAMALYRALDAKKSGLAARATSHKTETGFLDDLQDLLNENDPLSDEHRKHPARDELLRRLQLVAANRANDLGIAMFSLRDRRAADNEDTALLGELSESIDALQADKDVWNNLRRALVRKEFSDDVNGVANESLDRVRTDLQARRIELDLVGRSLDAEDRIDQRMGAMLPMLHISFLLGDRTDRWGLVIGNSSTFRGNRDVPGVYSKVQRTFSYVIDDLSDSGRALPGFESGTVDLTLNPADLIWSAPELIHGGAFAGTLGIYNVALCTVQEDLRREGTPDDTLDRLNLSNIRRQADQLGALIAGVAAHQNLSQASSIESEQTYIAPVYAKDHVTGAMAMVRSRGQEVNSPLPGVAIQVRRSHPSRDFVSHKPYAYDDFQVVLTDANGAYTIGPLYDTPNVVDNFVFGAKFSADGRVSHATDLTSKKTIKERLNLVRCGHGALVMPPQVQLGLPKFMIGKSDAVLGEERSNTGVEDGIAFWFCEPKVDTVKLFGLDASIVLLNGPPVHGGNAERAVKTTDRDPAEGHQGTGVAANGPYPAIAGTAQAATDLWRVNESRMKILRDRSIMNTSIEELHGRTEDLLLSMNQIDAVSEKEATAASALLAERAVYTNVRNSMEDLVHAVLVLLALSVPFAFILERLLIGAVNVYKQIIGFAGIFTITFLLLFVSHPAFSVSKTPVIIFLGFGILVLSGMVIFIIMRKFEAELKVLQGMTATVHAADVSRFGTMFAAVSMGVSTMRRRPLRTALTSTTIILLTFTILCFASFGVQTGVIRIFLRSAPSYAGVFFHQVNWRTLPEPILEVFKGRWSAVATICPRYWVTSDWRDRALAITQENGTRPVPLRGVLGLDSEELLHRDDLLELLGGAMKDIDGTVFVTKEIGERLGLGPGDPAILGGHTLEVGPFLNSSKFATVNDMDNSNILPVDFQDISNKVISWDARPASEKEGVGMLQRNPNWAVLLPDSVAIVSSAAARGMGANLRSVNLYTPDHATAEVIVQDIARMLRHPVSATRSDGVYRHLLGPIVQAGNIRTLLFPLLLGGLVVFGTMLGSVSDRQKEIYSFSALGLAPAHVASLFFAEAMVYSVIGGLAGYLLAQGSVEMLTMLAPITGLRVPEMNYSSLNAIVTILVVMAMVMVSAIYPAIKASRSANPGVMRTWRMPAPENDTLNIVFPFTVSQYDFTGIVSFLKEHFDNYSDTGLGTFRAQNASVVREEKDHLGLQAELALAPLDLGVTQSFELRSAPSEVEGIDEVNIQIVRQSGQPKDWRRLNKVLLNDLRRQFLIWRSLSQEAMELYRQRTLEEMGQDED